ncbi:MAG: DNA mismatch repair endonuclease MutL [Epsilonproteobacteria bacterium]|nr:MAG: DNA mismatch repair endonuclease MutL [Campylobacterota bacterium]RLA64894.1 MAG: DNA mismatch repair endonuclease MutL [Campylobacterota bacterium]
MEITPRIKELPNHLIDQIKAGEVIEKPASILKELIENSLDAGADKVHIQIENNGLDLIAVSDNGHGMNYEDLPKAFGRHATSKLNKFEDLYQLSSFGFRGEALASMSSISRITCSSSPKSGHGGKLVIHGGQQVSHIEFENNESGTAINIRDLFYNTPVRLKFIKSKTSEKNAIWKTLNSFILSNPKVSFFIKYGSGDKAIYPAKDNIKERLKQVFKKNNEDFIVVNGEYEGHKIFAMVGPKSGRGSSKNNQFLFANKRLFSDKAIHSAVLKAMEGVWGPGESGAYCLMLDIPPSYLDVNVHPRKTEVRFFKSSIVFSLVRSSIEKSKPKKTFSFDNADKGDLENLLNENFSMKNNWESEGVNSSPNLFSITESFFLFNHNGRPYLINAPILFEKYINLKMREVVESEIVPLLIAEPYPIAYGPIDNLFEELSAFGFIINRPDKETILVKSVPDYLSELPIRNILSLFFTYLEKAPKKGLKDSFLSIDNIKMTKFSLQQILLMLKPFLSTWGSSEFAKPLNDEVLHRIYH